jgi:hypothetical protein
MEKHCICIRGQWGGVEKVYCSDDFQALSARPSEGRLEAR